MAEREDDCNDTSESTTVTNPFAKQSQLETALADINTSELAKVTDKLATNLTKDIEKMATAVQTTSRLGEALERFNREDHFRLALHAESRFDELREMLEDIPTGPSTHIPRAAINPPAPPRTKRERLELSPAEAEQLLEESGMVVTCDACEHQYLRANAHRMATNEDGERLCGRCRDATRGIQ